MVALVCVSMAQSNIDFVVDHVGEGNVQLEGRDQSMLFSDDDECMTVSEPESD